MRKLILGTLTLLMTSIASLAHCAVVTINEVTIALNSSQIKSLNEIPQTILPGQGYGVVTIPVSMQIKLIYGGSEPFEASGNTLISYGGSKLIAKVNNSIFWERKENFYTLLLGSFELSSASSLENQPIVISSTSEIFGNPSYNNSAVVNFVYYTIDL